MSYPTVVAQMADKIDRYFKLNQVAGMSVLGITASTHIQRQYSSFRVKFSLKAIENMG